MVRERCSTVFPRWLHYWQRSSERNRKKGVKRYWLKWYPVRLLWLVSRECMPFLLVSGEYPQLLLVCEDFMSILLACREYPQSHWSAEKKQQLLLVSEKYPQFLDREFCLLYVYIHKCQSYWLAKNIHNLIGPWRFCVHLIGQPRWFKNLSMTVFSCSKLNRSLAAYLTPGI